MLTRPVPGAGSWKNQGEFQFLLSLLNDVLNHEEKKEQKSVAFFQFKETDPGHVFQHLGQEPGRYSVSVPPGKVGLSSSSHC